ncbi:MAG: hypothetical protein V1492_01985 [Candidatus Micrarchaeota archaeon]
MSRAQGGARRKIYEETKKLYVEECEAKIEPVKDSASKLSVALMCANQDPGNRPFDYAFGEAMALAEKGDFLSAGALLRDVGSFKPANAGGTERCEKLADRSMGELVQRVFEAQGANAAEELIRLLTWNGTGIELNRLPGADRIINTAIDSLEQAGDLRRAFEIGAYWQRDYLFYIGYRSPVETDRTECLFAAWRGL